MKRLARHVPRYVLRYTSSNHHLFDVRTAISLERDVAVRAVYDAARIKIPRIVFYAFDSSLVLAWEGHARQTAATVKRPLPDARHTVADCHTR